MSEYVRKDELEAMILEVMEDHADTLRRLAKDDGGSTRKRPNRYFDEDGYEHPRAFKVGDVVRILDGRYPSEVGEVMSVQNESATRNPGYWVRPVFSDRESFYFEKDLRLEDER